jgi:putative membrane protein
MRSFLIHWLITTASLAAASRLVAGVHFSSLLALLAAALVLGLINAVVRPVLVLLTLPITILTLGLFYLVVNGAAFAIASALVPGFTVSSFGAAVMGALAVSLLSWLLGWLLNPRPQEYQA